QGRRKGSELVSRYTIRREEEIGKRLSDAPYMYSTNSVVNANTFMSAMRSRRGAMALNQKWRRWKRGRSHLWERRRLWIRGGPEWKGAAAAVAAHKQAARWAENQSGGAC